jgi:TorA maturation chaperone TorD
VEWQWRSYVYVSLACLFRKEPDEEILAALSEEQQLSCLFEDLKSLLPVAVELEADIAAHTHESDAYQAQLREDFNRLFIGPGPLLAPPWESVHRSRERLLFGEHTLAVRDFYHSFGLKAAKQEQEPEDHIALELEFAGWLCQQAANAESPEQAGVFIDGHREFLVRHMFEWVPAFCGAVSRSSETAFYRKLAILTMLWLDYEKEAVHIE